MVALHSEAKPIIDHYRLQRLTTEGFPLYVGASCVGETPNLLINLVVTGIGQLAMAAAVGWLAGRQENTKSAWLNLGTAGHLDATLGEIFRVAQCTNADDHSAHLPPLVSRWQGEIASLQTVDRAMTDYPPVAMVDMEAHAFFGTACRFAPAELVQSLKVVSDNQGTDLDTLSGEMFSQLVGAHTEKIVDFIEGLVGLAAVLPKTDPAILEFQQMMSGRRLTVNQRREIESFAQDLINLGQVEALSLLAIQYEQPKALIAAMRAESDTHLPKLHD